MREAFLILPLAILLGCNGPEARATTPSSVESGPIKVIVERPSAVEGHQTLVLPGTLEAYEVALLYAQVTGYLESVSVDIGDRVERGAPLARIVVPAMRAQIKSAEAAVAREKAQLELARITRTRLESLRTANPEAIPQQDVDVAGAKEQIQAARVAVAEAEVERLSTLNAFARIRAPFAGAITKRVLHPGALVREGTTPKAEPVLEIGRGDKLRLAFEVPEPVAPRVQKGAAVKVRLDAFPGEELSERIARISPALDATTRSKRAEIDLADEEGRFQPGMYASVEIDVAVAKGALSVPSRAVRGRGAGRYCLVVEEGVLRKKPVVIASDDGRRAVVARGLGPADQVMVAGSPLARDGVACEAVEAS